jgi:hypothetical protein
VLESVVYHLDFWFKIHFQKNQMPVIIISYLISLLQFQNKNTVIT